MRLDDLISDIKQRLEDIEQSLCNSEIGTSDSENETWMPPQQQKLELLKKAVGVDSEYDEESEDCDCEHESDSDELEILKRNAGILNVLSDDDLE